MRRFKLVMRRLGCRLALHRFCHILVVRRILPAPDKKQCAS